MEGNLVIVESPTKAKTIQKYLGDSYVVKSSRGHVRDLHEKSLSVDVADGFKPEYVIPSDKKSLVAELKKLAQKAQTVWLASDEDREGEAISWHLAQTLGLDMSRTHRIAFHEITKDAILNAVEHPRDIDMDLVNAQQARRVLDRLVGFELSPVLWRKIKRGLSAGRVQSVALRLIVDREREIEAFKPEAFYRVEAEFRIGRNKVKGVLDRKFQTIVEARAFLQDSIPASYSVESVDEKAGTKMPPAPFTTSTLQQEASRKLRMPANVTMRVAQSLYERGLITYMRTDSTNLSSLALGTAAGYIKEHFGEEYSHTRQYKTKSKGAQEAHEAIRPTFVSNVAIEGTEQEKRLYSLIWKRTLASQMSEARVMNTSVKIAVSTRAERYAIQASKVIFDGFLKLYMESVDDVVDTSDGDVVLPSIKVGDILSAASVKADCKYTQPPFRYSDASLVKKIEELEIGRPSTYATIITTLTTARGYVVKGDKEGRSVQVTNLDLKDGAVKESVRTETIGAEKGKLLPRDIGMIVTDYLVANFPDIMDYDFTANVEKDLDKIAEGELQWSKVISEFYSPFHGKIDEAIEDKQYNHVERVLGSDPSDGQAIVARFGQYGPYVQKGEGAQRQCASLQGGQLIESITLEEALKLFQLPRTVGNYDGTDIVALKGRFGPYLKYGDSNVSIPGGVDPLAISLEDCIRLIDEFSSKLAAAPMPIAEWPEEDVSVLNGRYGPYIKHAGNNYKIPSGTEAAGLTLQACKDIIASTSPSSRKFKRFKKSK